ncbi:MAG: cobalamin B12-binding domain-containing protein, partial [Spirochaetia bacterium]
MRILLIHPPKSPMALAPVNLEPLALEVLAATVPEHAVRILDLRLEGHDALRRALLSFMPRLVGVTVNNTIFVRSAIAVLREIEQVLPSSQVVVGGHHVTLAPEDFCTPEVDALFS